MNSTISLIYLGIAIGTEVIGTISLKTSESFTKLLPSAVSILCYSAAFYLFSLAIRTIPTGIGYAIWSGFGIILVSAVSWVWFKQALDLPAIIGMNFIVVGIVIINVLSKSVAH